MSYDYFDMKFRQLVDTMIDVDDGSGSEGAEICLELVRAGYKHELYEKVYMLSFMSSGLIMMLEALGICDD